MVNPRMGRRPLASGAFKFTGMGGPVEGNQFWRQGRPRNRQPLTAQVADAIDEVLAPRGVLVVIEAEHLCMSMRGGRKPGASTVTSAVRGLFRTDPSARAEAMRFVEHRR